MTDTSDPTEPTEITIKRYLCRHIHTSGSRCGSPALRGEQFCYYHHTTRRPGPRYRGVHPSAYEFEMPDLDDLAGIQFALAQVLALIAGNQIDPKRARLLLSGIDSASRALARNMRRVSTRSARRAAGSEDSSADASKQDLVEDLVLDPDHGPIALIAELAAPIDLEEARNKRFAQMLNDLTYPRDAPDPGSDPTLLSSRSEFGVPGELARRGEGVEGSASCHSDPQPATDNLQSATLPDPDSQPATDNLQPATLPILQAVAELPVVTTSVVAFNLQPATNNLQKTAPHLLAEIGDSCIAWIAKPA